MLIPFCDCLLNKISLLTVCGIAISTHISWLAIRYGTIPCYVVPICTDKGKLEREGERGGGGRGRKEGRERYRGGLGRVGRGMEGSGPPLPSSLPLPPSLSLFPSISFSLSLFCWIS